MAELWERISPLFRGGFPNNNPNNLCGIHCHSYFHNAEKREEITMKETTCARRFLKTLILLHGNRSIVSESPLLELLPLSTRSQRRDVLCYGFLCLVMT